MPQFEPTPTTRRTVSVYNECCNEALAALRSGDTSLVQRHMTLAAQLAAHLEAGLNDAESMAEMFQCECDKCEVCSQAAATAANLDVTIEQIRTGQWDCELKSNQ